MQCLFPERALFWCVQGNAPYVFLNIHIPQCRAHSPNGHDYLDFFLLLPTYLIPTAITGINGMKRFNTAPPELTVEAREHPLRLPVSGGGGSSLKKPGPPGSTITPFGVRSSSTRSPST